MIQPADDGITGPGTITWWVEAIDNAGASTNSSKQSISVVRCDAEATITSTLLSPSENYLSFGCSSQDQVSGLR